MNYYNEPDFYASDWLRALISHGQLAPGRVDERPIQQVRPNDLEPYTQHHFFAGIGGWPYALDLAGWPADAPVWTGSCPCQPFSHAGSFKGAIDRRHLWPAWLSLIIARHPPVVFGEQVASAITHGWLDQVAGDLESQGYSVGAAVLPACAVGSPQKRDRLWFVAHSNRQGQCYSPLNAEMGGTPPPLSHPDGPRLQNGGHPAPAPSSPEGRWDVAQSELERRCSAWWSVEPDLGRVAHGLPGRVDQLRSLGNSIVPHLAAAFILAAREAIQP